MRHYPWPTRYTGAVVLGIAIAIGFIMLAQHQYQAMVCTEQFIRPSCSPGIACPMHIEIKTVCNQAGATQHYYQLLTLGLLGALLALFGAVQDFRRRKAGVC